MKMTTEDRAELLLWVEDLVSELDGLCERVSAAAKLLAEPLPEPPTPDRRRGG